MKRHIARGRCKMRVTHRLANMFHHRRELVAHASEEEAAWKGDTIMAFKSRSLTCNALQVQTQSESYGLDADGFLYQITASLAYIIIMAGGQCRHLEIAKQGLQVTRVDLDRHVAPWLCWQGRSPQASWLCARQMVFEIHFTMI